MNIQISNIRKDGKYPVTLVFQGQTNMFGGYTIGKVFKKLYSLEKLKDLVKEHGTKEQKTIFKVNQ